MDDQEPLIVNLPALTPVNCNKHLHDCLVVPSCTRDVDAATTDSNGNNTDASIMSEEFDCGVSVSGPETDKQEWSFTLYDFDGQGNITKEGLATLLKTLYDAVGTTVNKQRQNTKSLRLRLTLSPDTTQQAAASKPSLSPAADNSDKAHGCAAGHTGCELGSKDMKVKMNNLLQCDKAIGDRLRHGRTADIMTRNNVSSQSAANRSGAKDVQHLVSLSPEHENKASTNACAVNVDNCQVSDEATANNNNNNRRMLRNRRCVSSHFDNPDKRNHYLDLAGVREVDSINAMMERSMATGIAAVASPRVSRQQARRSQQQQQQQRVDKDASRFGVKLPEHCQQRDVSCSRVAAADGGSSKQDNENNKESFSNESRLSNDCTTRVARETTKQPTHRLRCASCSAAASARIREQAYIMQESLSASASPQHRVDIGQTTAAAAATTSATAATGRAAAQNNCSPSHYHHRHKNRARNQTRAMRQVMDWLEDADKPAASLPPRELVVVQRHEHHHVHEYHHHHYHHYDEKNKS